MIDSYDELARIYEALLQQTTLPVFTHAAALPPRTVPTKRIGAPHVVLFSPHPDDECIVGILPLRLMQEAGFAITNVAVTLGSDPKRQAARKQELQLACDYLGFDLQLISDAGPSAVTLHTQTTNPQLWQMQVASIVGHIVALKPDIVLIPHRDDGHPSHQGTGVLVMEALKVSQHPCWVVQTEFWHPLARPNLMVECHSSDLGILMAGLACHAGEVSRNPYHLRLPAWMADNVRRGAELIVGPGKAAPHYAFATLYRIDRWDGHCIQNYQDSHFIDREQDLVAIFQIIK